MMAGEYMELKLYLIKLQLHFSTQGKGIFPPCIQVSVLICPYFRNKYSYRTFQGNGTIYAHILAWKQRHGNAHILILIPF